MRGRKIIHPIFKHLSVDKKTSAFIQHSITLPKKKESISALLYGGVKGFEHLDGAS